MTDPWTPRPGPTVEPLTMPSEYGAVGDARLPWSWARERLEPAMVYWLTTLRADGSPHVRPVDGTWVDDALFVGGSDEAAWVRNLARDARATVNLPDVREVVMVEGTGLLVTPDAPLAERLAAAAAKYASLYGPASPTDYLGKPVWAIVPRRAMGWQRFPTDATRWVFEQR